MANTVKVPLNEPASHEVSVAFCGVEQAARLLGDKWTLVVLRDLGSGAKHFSELETLATGISPRTLVARLRNLEDAGLVTRDRQKGLPPRVVYDLTPKGRDALPVVEALRRYGNRWLCNPDG
jgi:DNA-binding HxlR family transcriptional regulator